MRRERFGSHGILLILAALLGIMMAMIPFRASAAGVYEIRNADDLKNMAADPAGTYSLERNINLRFVEWTPIGTEDVPFTGTFIGNGHTIKGLMVSQTEYNAGLFGVTSGARISGLRVNGVVGNVDTYGGGIIGHATNNTLIRFCINQAAVSGKDQIGGVVGRISDSVMKSCINYGKVVATGRGAGGITADQYPSGKIVNCVNFANVTGGNDLTGGITGGCTDGPVTGCINLGNVISTEGGRIHAIAGDNASYAGIRKRNNFRKTARINSVFEPIGEKCGTFKSRKAKIVTKKVAKIMKGFKKR